MSKKKSIFTWRLIYRIPQNIFYVITGVVIPTLVLRVPPFITRKFGIGLFPAIIALIILILGIVIGGQGSLFLTIAIFILALTGVFTAAAIISRIVYRARPNRHH